MTKLSETLEELCKVVRENEMKKKKMKKCKKEARWTVWPGHGGDYGHLDYTQSCSKHLSDTIKNAGGEAYIYPDKLGGPCYWTQCK